MAQVCLVLHPTIVALPKGLFFNRKLFLVTVAPRTCTVCSVLHRGRDLGDLCTLAEELLVVEKLLIL